MYDPNCPNGDDCCPSNCDIMCAVEAWLCCALYDLAKSRNVIRFTFYDAWLSGSMYLPQFKYTYALKSFNAFNAKGPVDLLDDINKGIQNTAKALKRYDDLLKKPSDTVPSPMRNEATYCSPRPPTSPYVVTPIGAEGATLRRSPSAQIDDGLMGNIDLFNAALENYNMDIDNSPPSSASSSPSLATTTEKNSKIKELEEQLAKQKGEYSVQAKGFKKLIKDLQSQIGMLRNASEKKDEARKKRDAAQAKLEEENKRTGNKSRRKLVSRAKTRCLYCGWNHLDQAPWQEIYTEDEKATLDHSKDNSNPVRGCQICPDCEQQILFTPKTQGVDIYKNGNGTYKTLKKPGTPHIGPIDRSGAGCGGTPGNPKTLVEGGMKIKIKSNKTQKIYRKKGRKSQNKRKKKIKGSKKRHKRPHRNTRKTALKIEN